MGLKQHASSCNKRWNTELDNNCKENVAEGITGINSTISDCLQMVFVLKMCVNVTPALNIYQIGVLIRFIQ